jgi:predicted flap endonuclease-1-like 5' DNA nuclease
MTSLKEIEGIGPKYARQLAAAGVRSTEALLKLGATKKGRKELEVKTGIGHKSLLEWVNLADLFRVPGVGEQYSDLLEEAGVDTVLELSIRKPDALTEKLMKINTAKNLVNRPPSAKVVAKWIKAAQKLKRVVEY